MGEKITKWTLETPGANVTLRNTVDYPNLLVHIS
jgi:hypothetical protein